jgi:hypothetical protein
MQDWMFVSYVELHLESPQFENNVVGKWQVIGSQQS